MSHVVLVSLPLIFSKTLTMSLVGVAFPVPPEDILAPFDGGYLNMALWQRCHGASPCQLAGDDCYSFCELVFVTLET